jgi:putative transposase
VPRASRLLIDDQPTVYHVMSRACLDGHPLGPVEKDYLLAVMRKYAAIYFVEILGFCLMGNHFHLLVRMQPKDAVSDEEVLERYKTAFEGKDLLNPARISFFREKWTSLSEFVREIKQTFSRYYNKRHLRRGFFWGGRFKSVIVEDGRTLINCLAYIDLNPIRAGIVERPEDYRWCSLGYHAQSNNRGGLLSLDFGLADWDIEPGAERLRLYREYVYRSGALDSLKGKAMDERIVERASSTNFQYTPADRLRMRTRWFSDSAILGSRAFVADLGQKLGLASDSRRPKRIPGGDEMYSFRRLAELL